jgi:plasmid stabilization system protein ParE
VTTYKAELSPEALAQADAAMRWWNDNRPKAPGLFLEELDAALERLMSTPMAGLHYRDSGITGMRRLVMPRTRYHVYYTVVEEEALIRIHAIWHSSRGRGPIL